MYGLFVCVCVSAYDCMWVCACVCVCGRILVCVVGAGRGGGVRYMCVERWRGECFKILPL